MKNIPSGQIQLGSGGTVSSPAGPGAKAPEALKSLHSTLPEVVKKSTLLGHFFYVLHLKVTEKITKIHNKVPTFSNQCRPITFFYKSD